MANGVHPRTVYSWFREERLPVPAQRVGPGTILVNVEAHSGPEVAGGLVLYACVPSHDQKSDLERRVARLTRWAATTGRPVVRFESEIASGMNGARSKAKRMLADPAVTTVVVEHKDRLGRVNVELIEAALSAAGRCLVGWMTARSKMTWCRHGGGADLVLCARLYGRRSAKNRAMKALEAAEYG